MTDKRPKVITRPRRSPWPSVLFVLIVGVMLILQSGLEIFSVGMGLSCDVTGATERAPWFMGICALIVVFAMISFGFKRALRAVGHAVALQLALTGWLILTLFAYGRCISQEYPSFMERHAHPIGWVLLGTGLMMLAGMRAVSYFANRSWTRPKR